MIRRPPRSTLFPTRRSSDLCLANASRYFEKQIRLRPLEIAFWLATRSEEHTSELQSRENLVCRLLLEKKKEKAKPPTTRKRHSDYSAPQPTTTDSAGPGATP